MREIFDGVFHWTTFHDPIGLDVSSYYVAPAAVVIDPKLPEGGFDSLPGRPQQVLLTSGHHNRDAAAFAEEFGIPIRVSLQSAEYLGGQLEVETFNDGDEVAPGITAIQIGQLSDDEGAFHVAVERGAISFADGLVSYGGAIGFVPDRLIGDHADRVKAGLKGAFSGLLTRDFEHLLVAHGDPVVGGAKSTLREFVESDADPFQFAGA